MTGTETVHQLWLDDEGRIVSFHPMEDLQQKGYRFQ